MSQVDFANGKIAQNIMRTALPMIVAQLLSLLYNIVDRIYIGRIPAIGTAALGGVGLCFPVILIITAFANLYGSGGAPLCAIERGKGNRENAERVMNIAFTMIICTAVLITVLGQVIARPLLVLFGASESALAYSLPYLRIYLLGTVFFMTATGINPYINAQGFPNMGMLTVAVGAVSNLILDPVFIFTMKLGIRGAAIATVISQTLSAAVAIGFLRGEKAELKIRLLRREEIRENSGFAKNIISLGTASFIMQFTNSLVQIACNRMLRLTGGDLYISVMTLVSSVRQVFDAPIYALTDGSSPVISYNYGARRGKKAKQAIFLMTIIGAAYTLVIWALVLLKPEMLLSIFTSDKSILTDAAKALHIYFFAFAFQTLQYAGQTAFKALNKKKRAIFFSLFRKVVLVVPLTFLLPTVFHLGTDGVFMAEPISNVVGGTACFVTMLITVMPELNSLSNNK